jgi:hypothetical protein
MNSHKGLDRLLYRLCREPIKFALDKIQHALDGEDCSRGHVFQSIYTEGESSYTLTERLALRRKLRRLNALATTQWIYERLMSTPEPEYSTTKDVAHTIPPEVISAAQQCITTGGAWHNNGQRQKTMNSARNSAINNALGNRQWNPYGGTTPPWF